MTAKVKFVKRELTENGGSGLCWMVLFYQDGKIVDRAWCGCRERAAELAASVHLN